jgi:tRNA(Ile2) C34 agmatinyltransferase TiaS
MIYVGLDDTDMLDSPGNNKLARHLVEQLRDKFNCRLIVRHQLLEDPRVPCTRKNGCASILLEPIDAAIPDAAALADRIRPIMLAWCPAGSDPGLCIAPAVPDEVVQWGRRVKRELVTQAEARQIAAAVGIFLEGLGGTQDGVIGALAAVGLMATRNDGRVVYLGGRAEDQLDVTGSLSVDAILARGIDEVRGVETNEPILRGEVLLAKRLRPNYRRGRVMLYVARQADDLYEAVRVM